MLCCASNLRVQWLGGELVPPLTLLVVKQHHSVHGAHRELGVVRRPGHACDLGSAILEKKKKEGKKNNCEKNKIERTQKPVVFAKRVNVSMQFKQFYI